MPPTARTEGGGAPNDDGQDEVSSRSRTAALALLATLIVSVGTSQAVPAGSDGEPDDAALIDAWVTDRMEAHGIPGTAVAVVRGGRTVHLRGYGTADGAGRPVRTDTPFLIGSVSKPFTAHVVRQLVDERKLSLDEPVLPHLTHLVATPPDGFETVTVRHLLTHTAGIGLLVGLPGNVAVHTTDDALDRRVADVLSRPLAARPGEEYIYSNAGYALLAAAVEQVTGQPFHELVRDRILTPIGMIDSITRQDDPATSRLATGHRQWFGQWRPAELPFDPAGIAYGYLGSSIEDLTRFLHAHLNVDSTLVPATARQLAQDPVEPTGWDIPLESGQGLGWMIDDLAGYPVVSHAGSLGHFTAHLIMVPAADGLGIAVATNASAFIAAGHDGQYDLSVGLAELLLGQHPTPTASNPLLVYAAPILAWSIALALLAMILGRLTRDLPRLRRHGLQTTRVRRFWIRRIALPSAAYLGTPAVVLLTVPLATVRHFYPDLGTAVTVITYLALIWGLLRVPLTLAARPAPAEPHRVHPPDRRCQVRTASPPAHLNAERLV